MQTINTGYKPEFGLGAYFAGENAADVEASNQADQIKALLEQMKAQQGYQQQERMNPLDVFAKEKANQVAEYDAAYAQKKLNDPNYMDANLAGQIGQMQTQEAAGKTASALQPFKQRAEQSALENQKSNSEAQWTISDIDDKLAAGGGTDENGNVVPFTPMQRMFMQNKRTQLTEQLKNTPEFAGKKELSDDKIEAQLEAQRMRMQAMIDASDKRASSVQEKALSDKQLIAKAWQIVSGLTPATEQQKIAAQAILSGIQADKMDLNATLAGEQMDMGKAGVPMKPSNASIQREKAAADLRKAQGGNNLPTPNTTSSGNRFTVRKNN